MTYSELLVYIAMFYIVIIVLIIVSTLCYLSMSGKGNLYSLRTMFHIGRPVIQFLVIIMVVSVIVMTSKYFGIRTFNQVVTSVEASEVYSLSIVVGKSSPILIKDQESIHRFIMTLEETKYMPSIKESTILTRTPICGQEIQVDFLGLETMDSIVISSRGVLYNRTDGQAYEVNGQDLYQRIEQLLIEEESL